jgi:hypothetical protein
MRDFDGVALPLPWRMRHLPRFEGRAVPWSVPWSALESDRPTVAGDGRPRFELSARIETWDRAMRERRCWMCGRYLGAIVCFVMLPINAVTRVTTNPPCHVDCADYAVKTWPEDDVWCLWSCRRYGRVKTMLPVNDGWLVTFSGPTVVRWFAGGRPARRAEVLSALSADMPQLRAQAAPDLAGKSEIEQSFAELLAKHVPRW